MKWVFSFFLLFITSCQTVSPPSKVLEPTLSILQGATDQTSTQINIVAPAGKTFEITISMDKSVLQTPEQKIQTRENSSWQVIQLYLKDLTSDLTYTLRVYENKELVDERQFKVLPKVFDRPRVLVASCTSDDFVELQKKQWKQIQDQQPDLLFLIGDNVYVDIGAFKVLTNVTSDDIWRRYVETRLALDLYKMKKLIPTFATWDDHDYGVNDGDSRFPYKEDAKNIFRTFFPMADNGILTTGPGVSASLNIQDQQFLFLDDRSFRSPVKSLPQTHFGKEQKEWLLQKVKNHKGLSWLISGDQFFGGYHPFESYEGKHPQDFQVFLKDLKKIKKPVVFISGDRHIAEVIKLEKSLLGYETYELTSSGLHSKMYPGAIAKNPNRRSVFGKDGESNYLILQMEPTESGSYSFETVFWGEDLKVHYQQKYNVKKN